MADPSGIALTFMDEGMRDRVRLDSIMCVVDAEQIFAAPEMMKLKLRQVAFADMLILNKVDLVTPEIGRVKAWLDDRFHRYRLVEASGETCRWRSCCRSAGSIPRVLRPPLHTRSPGWLPTVTIPIVGITLVAIGTTTRRSSGRGATKRRALSLDALRKPRAGSRPAFTDAKAWFIPPTHRADGSSFRWSEASRYRRGR